MTPKKALDCIISGLSNIDASLSGDDSPLANPWEEIKDQLQSELSVYWPSYVDTMHQFVSGFVADLSSDDLAELNIALRCSSREAVDRQLFRRLLSRGKKEKIGYAAFDFTYFCYPLLDFTAYGEVVERRGLDHCYARVFSIAAPHGELGIVETCRISAVLSQEQFDAARTCGWSDPPPPTSNSHSREV